MVVICTGYAAASAAGGCRRASVGGVPGRGRPVPVRSGKPRGGSATAPAGLASPTAVPSLAVRRAPMPRYRDPAALGRSGGCADFGLPCDSTPHTPDDRTRIGRVGHFGPAMDSSDHTLGLGARGRASRQLRRQPRVGSSRAASSGGWRLAAASSTRAARRKLGVAGLPAPRGASPSDRDVLELARSSGATAERAAPRIDAAGGGVYAARSSTASALADRKRR